MQLDKHANGMAMQTACKMASRCSHAASLSESMLILIHLFQMPENRTEIPREYQSHA
jgi:hypothetical protein